MLLEYKTLITVLLFAVLTVGFLINLSLTDSKSNAIIEMHESPKPQTFAEELRKALKSEEIKNIKHGLGSVNQFIDSDRQLNNLFW